MRALRCLEISLIIRQACTLCTTASLLRGSVLSSMTSMPALDKLPLHSLASIPIGSLRKDAVCKHAVCRRRGAGASVSFYICLHPIVLRERMWQHYARFLLFHEFLHALGFWQHNNIFRNLEQLWDTVDADVRTIGGHQFARYLIARDYRWTWVCPECGREHFRLRRQNGRFTWFANASLDPTT